MGIHVLMYVFIATDAYIYTDELYYHSSVHGYHKFMLKA